MRRSLVLGLAATLGCAPATAVKKSSRQPVIQISEKDEKCFTAIDKMDKAMDVFVEKCDKASADKIIEEQRKVIAACGESHPLVEEVNLTIEVAGNVCDDKALKMVENEPDYLKSLQTAVEVLDAMESRSESDRPDPPADRRLQCSEAVRKFVEGLNQEIKDFETGTGDCDRFLLLKVERNRADRACAGKKRKGISADKRRLFEDKRRQCRMRNLRYFR